MTSNTLTRLEGWRTGVDEVAVQRVGREDRLLLICLGRFWLSDLLLYNYSYKSAATDSTRRSFLLNLECKALIDGPYPSCLSIPID